MARSLLGRDTYLYVNTGVATDGIALAGGTWTEADLATDLTVDRSKNEIDATNRASARLGWTVTQQGLKSFKIDFDSHKVALGETPNAANALIDSAFDDNTEIEALITNGDIQTGTAVASTWSLCSVGGGSESQPLDDVVTISYSLTNADIPASGAWTTGVYTPN